MDDPDAAYSRAKRPPCLQTRHGSLDNTRQDCDAGHILANRLGGPGTQPTNIFPQVREGLLSIAADHDTR
jgi:hypothetical protein